MSHYEIADPLRNTLWDALVVAHPQASFFHSTAWARVLMASYGFEPFYISSLSGGRLTECLALMEAKSRWFGVRGVSLPFTDICPVLGTELMSGEQLIQEGLRLGVVRHWKYLELRVGRRPHGLEAAIPSQKYYGHEVDLSTTEEMVFRRFDAPVQRAIRKAHRSGVSCEISRDMEAMKHFYSLHSKTRQKHGLPPQPFSFFRLLTAGLIIAVVGAPFAAATAVRIALD